MGTQDGRRSNFRMVIGVVATIAVTGLALLALTKVLGEVEPQDVASSFARTGIWRMAAALALTAGCYLALSGYDRIALRSLGKAVTWRKTILGSTAAYALSHNLGFAPVTASFARHRVYRHDGVGVADVARVVVLTGASFWLGVILVMGICLIVVPDLLAAKEWSLSRPMQIAAGLIIVDVVIIYLLLISKGLRNLGWKSWSVPLPSLPDAIVQSGISLLEMALASAILWVLLPEGTLSQYPMVLVAYVSAFVMVLISHAPGGAGVLEAVVILMLPDIPKAEVLSALILFRIAFHFIPLMVAIAIIAMHSRTRPSPEG